MRLKKDSILPFGINKGYSIAETFQYYPEYIQWIMEKHSSAFIDDPNELIHSIDPTPFPSFKIENQFKSLPIEVEGIPFKPNSVSYAKIFLKQFSLTLDSLTTDYNLRMQNAYELHIELFNFENELYQINPQIYQKPEHPGDPIPTLNEMKYEFTESSLKQNLKKKMLYAGQ